MKNLILVLVPLFILIDSSFAVNMVIQGDSVATRNWSEPSSFQLYDGEINNQNINIVPLGESKSHEYDYTGESLFKYVSVTGALYLDISMDSFWRNKYNDLKVKWGTFEFYQELGFEPHQAKKKKIKLITLETAIALFICTAIAIVYVFKKR